MLPARDDDDDDGLSTFKMNPFDDSLQIGEKKSQTEQNQVNREVAPLR